jgi:hypothetical protein
MKVNTNILLLFAIFLFSFGNHPPGKYIRLIYNGEQLKQYPRILLYVEGSIDPSEDSISTHFVKLSKESFAKITKEIALMRDIKPDSMFLKGNNYSFRIFDNEETTIFLTPYLARVRQIFDMIMAELKTSDEETRVKHELQNVLIRLVYDNNLN